MESKDYKVNRDDVFVGILSATQKDKIIYDKNGVWDSGVATELEIYSRYTGKEHELNAKIMYNMFSTKEENHRTIIFTLDDNNHCNDLLFNCPRYPIFNISDDNKCLNADLSIKYCCNFSKFLEYFGFPNELSFYDVQNFTNNFFGDFVLDNCNLFGVKETDSETTGAETFDFNGNHRTFNERNTDGDLPLSYFYTLWHTRAHNEKEDIFKPLKEEGFVEYLGAQSMLEE